MTPPRDDTVCALAAAVLTGGGESDLYANRSALADRLEELAAAALAADVRAAAPHLLAGPLLAEVLRRHAGRSRDVGAAELAATAYRRELRLAARTLFEWRRGGVAGEAFDVYGPYGGPVARGLTGRGREFRPWTPSVLEDAGGDIVDRGRPPEPAWPDVWLDRARTLRHCRVLVGRGLVGLAVPDDAARLVHLTRAAVLPVLIGAAAAERFLCKISPPVRE